MILAPLFESVLIGKLVSSGHLKGQHLTFDVLSSTFGSRYVGLASVQLRLKG